MNKTLSLRSVAQFFIDNPDQPHWSVAITEATGVKQSALAGTQGILQRLVHHGALEDAGQVPSEIRGGSPRRTYKTRDIAKLKDLL